MQPYRARNPRKSPLWQCLNSSYKKFENIYAETYQPRYGILRPIIPEVVQKFLDCGDLKRGFTRIRCDHCKREYLRPFSCKCRGFCPSCHQRNVQTTARFIVDHVVAKVPHRHYVLTIPIMLRAYFQRDRRLLKALYALAYESLTEYLRTAADCHNGVPGIILKLHTFGEYLDFHPHIHALVADGLFVLQQPPGVVCGVATESVASALPGIAFVSMPRTPSKPLEELFRAKVINFLVVEKLLPPERVQILYSRKNSGFSAHAGEAVPPEATADLERLTQYLLRNAFSLEKITQKSVGDSIIYRSQFNPKVKGNFQAFKPLDFLAAVTQHIPEKGAQTIHYYGQYSNKARGLRQENTPVEALAHNPSVPRKMPAKLWRDLILRVWGVDPLRCPTCQHSMRIIAVIEDSQTVEMILRHLGAWHDPPTWLPPPAASEPYTYEPCDGVDPMPDYESAPTD